MPSSLALTMLPSRVRSKLQEHQQLHCSMWATCLIFRWDQTQVKRKKKPSKKPRWKLWLCFQNTFSKVKHLHISSPWLEVLELVLTDNYVSKRWKLESQLSLLPKDYLCVHVRETEEKLRHPSADPEIVASLTLVWVHTAALPNTFFLKRFLNNLAHLFPFPIKMWFFFRYGAAPVNLNIKTGGRSYGASGKRLLSAQTNEK